MIDMSDNNKSSKLNKIFEPKNPIKRNMPGRQVPIPDRNKQPSATPPKNK